MMFKAGISPRLDIADSLLIYEVDTNTGVASRSESCRLDFDQPFQLVSFLREKGISTILCGGCPQFFWRMLFFYGFEVFPGVTGDPEDLVKRLAAGGKKIKKGGSKKMKVAIATDNGEVSAHFGRCPNYTIFEVDVEAGKILERMVIDTPPHQPGFLPGFLNEKGVNVVIAGGMGPRAQGFFTRMNIHPIIGISGAVEEVIRAYLEDRLVAGESLCDHGKPGHQTCDHD